MKRRRFFEAVTAALLAVTMITAGFLLAAPVMAQGKGGGKNKDDGGGTVEPAPLPNIRYGVTEIVFPSTYERLGGRFISGLNNMGIAYGSYVDPEPDVLALRRAYIFDSVTGEFFDLSRDVLINAQIEILFGENSEADEWSFRSVIGMNDYGQIVGAAEHLLDGRRKGIVIDTTYDGEFSADTSKWEVIALPDLGSDYSYGRRINNLGYVVGVFERPDGSGTLSDGTRTLDAYLYNPWLDTAETPLPPQILGVYLSLGRPSIEMNNHSQIVGFQRADKTAFLHDPLSGETIIYYDLSYESVNGINDTAVFCGKGIAYDTKKRGERIIFRYDSVSGSYDRVSGLFSTSSEPTEINSSGDVGITDQSRHDPAIASLSHTGFEPDTVEQLLRLSDLVADPYKSLFSYNSSGQEQSAVRGINDRDASGYGQVAVKLYYDDGRPYKLVILTPFVPAD